MSKGFSFTRWAGGGRNLVNLAGNATLMGAIFLGHFAMATNSAQAEPRMVILEYPLEATKVLSLSVNRTGRGTISLTCGQCESGRIRLSVKPESRLTVNGVPHSLHGFKRGSSDLVSAFYRAPDGVLTRLIVSR